MNTKVSLSLSCSLSLCHTLPNCLGLGWQSRPDKWTQIVSGDRLKRSVCSPLYHSSSIARVWQTQCCLMDGCSSLFLSTSHSVHSHLLIPLHLVSLHFSISYCLRPFVIYLYALPPSCCPLLSLFVPLSLLWANGHVCSSVMCKYLNDSLCFKLHQRSAQTQTFKLLSDLSFCVCYHISVGMSISLLCLHSILYVLSAAGQIAWLLACKWEKEKKNKKTQQGPKSSKRRRN